MILSSEPTPPKRDILPEERTRGILIRIVENVISELIAAYKEHQKSTVHFEGARSNFRKVLLAAAGMDLSEQEQRIIQNIRAKNPSWDISLSPAIFSDLMELLALFKADDERFRFSLSGLNIRNEDYVSLSVISAVDALILHLEDEKTPLSLQPFVDLMKLLALSHSNATIEFSQILDEYRDDIVVAVVYGDRLKLQYFIQEIKNIRASIR